MKAGSKLFKAGTVSRKSVASASSVFGGKNSKEMVGSGRAYSSGIRKRFYLPLPGTGLISPPSIAEPRYEGSAPCSLPYGFPPSTDPWKQRLHFPIFQWRQHAQIFPLNGMNPHILVTHRRPRLRKVEAAINGLRRLGQKRLQQNRDRPQLFDEIVEHPVGRRTIDLDQFPRLLTVRILIG